MARRAFLKVLVGDVAAEGRTVYFSTDLLSDIEAVADTVGIIKIGRLLVSDELDRLRETHRAFRMAYSEVPPEEEMRAIRELPGVKAVEREGRGIRLLLLSRPISRTRLLLTKYAISTGVLLGAAVLGKVLLLTVAAVRDHPLGEIRVLEAVLSVLVL